MNLSRRTVTIIASVVLIALGVGVLVEAIPPVHKNIMALVVVAAGVMLLREAR